MSDSSVDILLVEDNVHDVKLALRAFRRHTRANTIRVARDGAEALDALFGTGQFAGVPAPRPKVVLLDLKLPLVDGTEVLARIRAHPGTRTLPVVILTSSREGSDIERCYQLGANSYIVKPVDFDQFLEVSRQLDLYWLRINQSPAP